MSAVDTMVAALRAASIAPADEIAVFRVLVAAGFSGSDIAAGMDEAMALRRAELDRAMKRLGV